MFPLITIDFDDEGIWPTDQGVTADQFRLPPRLSDEQLEDAANVVIVRGVLDAGQASD